MKRTKEEMSRETEAELMKGQGLTNIADADTPTTNGGFYDAGLNKMKPKVEAIKVSGKMELKLKHLFSESTKNPFPTEVLPIEMQDIIKEANQTLQFPIDYFSASMLYAVSVSIGNTHKLYFKEGWTESASIYLAIVGDKGDNKSHPFSFALAPIEKRDTRHLKYYQKALADYKEETGGKSGSEPQWNHLCVDDITMEKLAVLLATFPRGVGAMYDELAGWIAGFTRYKAGSDVSQWLSIFNGKNFKRERITSESLYIKNPFVSVAGTIQGKTLKRLMTPDLVDNGLMDRIIFVIPDELPSGEWSRDNMSKSSSEEWSEMLNKLLELDFKSNDFGDKESNILKYTPDAENKIYEWQKSMSIMKKLPDGAHVKGVISKLYMYVHRFALILQMMKYACNGTQKEFVDLDSVNGAIKLVDYFLKNSVRVEMITSTPKNPLEELTIKYRDFYETLPDKFETADARDVGAKMKYPVGYESVKKFLRRKDLFTKIEQGKYFKNL